MVTNVNSGKLFLLGAIFFGISVGVLALAGVGTLAVVSKIWFMVMAPAQYFLSLPMQRTSKTLHAELGRRGKKLSKDRDLILDAVKSDPTLLPSDMVESYNLWQSLLCSLAVRC